LLSIVFALVSVHAAGALDYGTKIDLPLVKDETKGTTEKLWITDWSPDGKYLAVGVGNPSDIWIISTADGSIANLTDSIEESCSIPAFIPGTNEVMYSRMHKVTEGDRVRVLYNLESIDVVSGEQRIVLENAFAGSVSRDGAYISCIDWNNPAHAMYDVAAEDSWVLDFSGMNILTDFGHSSISPDNTFFVTTLAKDIGINKVNPHALYRVSFDGETVGELLDDADPWYPKFSPDGTWLLYTRFDYTEMDESRNMPMREISVYNFETGEIIALLPDSPYMSLCGSWSPDGSQICYILDKNGTYELYIRDFEYAAPKDDQQLDVDENAAVPFAINGAFPNPFNPSTTIGFTLTETGFANLVIYNVMGQRIRSLVSGEMTSGAHSVVWDGCDDRGMPVSAGVYVTRLQMGGNIATGKMTLVK
jgi:WD40 repeat protein